LFRVDYADARTCRTGVPSARLSVAHISPVALPPERTGLSLARTTEESEPKAPLSMPLRSIGAAGLTYRGYAEDIAATAAARLGTFNLRKRLVTCFCAVAVVMPSDRAISLSAAPRAMSMMTSRWRGVSGRAFDARSHRPFLIS